MKIKISTLKAAKPEDVKRLARWLRLKNTDNMSHRHLCKLIMWLFTRREKREKGYLYTSMY